MFGITFYLIYFQVIEKKDFQIFCINAILVPMFPGVLKYLKSNKAKLN